MDDTTKNLMDTASVATVVGTISGLLPAVAALFTIVWTALRIYESKTVQGYLEKKRGGSSS